MYRAHCAAIFAIAKLSCYYTVEIVECWVFDHHYYSLSHPVTSDRITYLELHNEIRQENSAKLTNQRVSCAFTSSPFSFMCVISCLLPSSRIVILVFYLFFYRHQWTTCVRTVSVTVTVNTVHWFNASCSGTPVNNSIALRPISSVQSLGYIFAAGSICAALQISAQFSPKARMPTH